MGCIQLSFTHYRAVEINKAKLVMFIHFNRCTLSMTNIE